MGFNEAPIKFPPTFKYDVLRTLKKPKKANTKLNGWKVPTEKVNQLGDVVEREIEDMDEEDAQDVDDEGEAISLASTTWTSVHSRPATELEHMGHSTSSDNPTPQVSSRGVSLMGTAHKAKRKWLTLFSPSSPSIQPQLANSNSLGDLVDALVELRPAPIANHVMVSDVGHNAVPRPRTLSTTVASAEEQTESDRGVYDSSHKKRVPSW